MLLYKYRSLASFEFTSDIVLNNRLFAAPFFDLNDPMEGMFDHDPGTKREYLDSIIEGKKKLLICSLSKDYGNLLLWAHYADSFKGICVEIEVSSKSDLKIVNVNYSPFNVYVSDDSADRLDNLPELILSGKNEAWNYEKEVRILSSSRFITEGFKVRSIYLGLRTPDVLKTAISRMVDSRIPIYETEIDRATNSVSRKSKYR